MGKQIRGCGLLFVNRSKRRNYGALLLNSNRTVCTLEDDNELSAFFAITQYHPPHTFHSHFQSAEGLMFSIV